MLFWTAVFSVLVYVFNLPVMLLARFTPCYRERFHALFCPLAPAEPLDATPQPAEPARGEAAPTEGKSSFTPPDSA